MSLCGKPLSSMTKSEQVAGGRIAEEDVVQCPLSIS